MAGEDEAARRAREERMRARAQRRASEPEPTPGPRERAAEPEPTPRPSRAAPGRLSEAWARRIAAGLLAVAVLVAAAAIADIGPFSDPPTAAEEAMAAVEAFYAAAGEGDWDSFCDRLTRDARIQVETNVSRLTGSAAGSCEQALDAGSQNSFAGITVKVRDVNVIGTQARVDASVKTPGDPPELRSVLLVREDGVWLINDPG